MNRWVFLAAVIFLLAGIFPIPEWSPEQERAMEIGEEFLEDIDLQTGKALSIGLVHIDEVSASYLFYWRSAKGLEIPDMPRPDWCWVVRFENGYLPRHWWDILIDINTNEIVGGMSCR